MEFNKRILIIAVVIVLLFATGASVLRGSDIPLTLAGLIGTLAGLVIGSGIVTKPSQDGDRLKEKKGDEENE